MNENKRIILTLGIIIVIGAALITLVITIGNVSNEEDKDKEEKITAEDVRKMSDDEFDNLKPDEIDKMTKSGDKAFEKRRDKEMEEYEKSGQKAKDEQELKEYEQRYQQEQQIVEEVTPLIKEKAGGKDSSMSMGSLLSRPEIIAHIDDSGMRTVDVEMHNSPKDSITELGTVDDIDIKFYVSEILEPIIWSDKPKNFDQLNIEIYLYNWHKKGDEYKATATVNADELTTHNLKEPKVKIEKIQ